MLRSGRWQGPAAIGPDRRVGSPFRAARSGTDDLSGESAPAGDPPPAAHARHMQGEQCQANQQQALRREHHAVLVLVTHSMNAMMKSRAAMYPSMAHSSR